MVNMVKIPLVGYLCRFFFSLDLDLQISTIFQSQINLRVHFHPIDCSSISVYQTKRLVSSMWRQVPENRDVRVFVVVILDQLFPQPPNSNWLSEFRFTKNENQILRNVFPYLWNEYRYRLSSTGTKSIIMIYIACGSRPHNLTWNVGNIRRPVFVTIISVPCSWNLSHSCFVSNITIACAKAGWLDVDWKIFGFFYWTHEKHNCRSFTSFWSHFFGLCLWLLLSMTSFSDS